MKAALFFRLCILLVIFACPVKGQLPPQLPEYTLVFSDEFTIEDPVFEIDTSKWDRKFHWNQGSNKTGNLSGADNCFPDCTITVKWDRAYIEFNSADTTTLDIQNGVCSLILSKDQIQGEVWNWPPCDPGPDTVLATGLPCSEPCNFNGTDYTCLRKDSLPFFYKTGMLYSKKRYKYGFFEIRFRLPISPTLPYHYKGIGPNFWMFNTKKDSGNYWSEIDIYEVDAYDAAESHDNYYTATVHYSNKDEKKHPSQSAGLNALSAGIWHTAAAWWTDQFIKIYLDDSLLLTVSQNPLIPVDSLVAMPLIVDINGPAINYCNNFDTLYTQFPYIYEIDYIRVYQLNNQCDTVLSLCQVDSTNLPSGVYKEVSIGGASCVARIGGFNNYSLYANEQLQLKEGFSFEAGMGYFQVEPCMNSIKEAHSIVGPPPNAWKYKSRYAD